MIMIAARIAVATALSSPISSSDVRALKGCLITICSFGRISPAFVQRYAAMWVHGSNGSSAPGDHAIDNQHDDGPYHGADQSGAFSRLIPAERLSEKCRDEGADDTQDRGENETGRLIVAGHDEFGDDAGYEADDDGPENTHWKIPFSSGCGRRGCIYRPPKAARATAGRAVPPETDRSVFPERPERPARWPASLPEAKSL